MSIVKNVNHTGHFSPVCKKIQPEHHFSQKEKRISISRMAELTEISRDTLVYYIKEGLITPAFTSESGYKYFHPGQLRTMTYIKYMRRCGIHINDIRNMLRDMDSDEFFRILEERRKELAGQIRILERSLSFLDTLDAFLGFTEAHEPDRPFIAELEHKEFYLTPVHFCQSLNSVSSAGQLADFLDPAEGLPEQLICCRIPENVMLSDHFCEYMHQHADRVDQEESGGKILRPAGTYACVTHQGGSGTVKDTILLLKVFILKSGYRPSGDVYILTAAGCMNLTPSSDLRYLAEIAIHRPEPAPDGITGG